jgi:hypothetical protein
VGERIVVGLVLGGEGREAEAQQVIGGGEFFLPEPTDVMRPLMSLILGSGRSEREDPADSRSAQRRDRGARVLR